MRPIRTALFAPGSNERVMAKALGSGADAVILDLEDSVAAAAKREARGLVAKTIDEIAKAGRHDVAIMVRVNGVATGLLADDLFAVVASGQVKIHIDQRYPLADVQQAHRDLEARKTTGCTILTL